MKIGAEVGFHSNLWTGVISVAENEGTVNPILNELRFTSKANIYLQGWQMQQSSSKTANKQLNLEVVELNMLNMI